MKKSNYNPQPWTLEETQWLRSHFDEAITWDGLVIGFNYHFYPKVRNKSSIQQCCKKKLKLKGDKNPRKFKEEEDQFLKNNISTSSTLQELTDKFNDHFHVQRSKSQISDRCTKQLHLHISELNPDRRTGLFVSGSSVRDLPVGTIRESSTGTYIKVKKQLESTFISGYQRPYWIPYQEYVYRQHIVNNISPDESNYYDCFRELGYKLPQIEEGEFICFLDGDRHNFDIENLYPINRRISGIMSINRWWSNNRALTRTAILACQLHLAIKDNL